MFLIQQFRKHIFRGFKISVTKPAIRFQMSAFSPLVPGINKQVSFSMRVVFYRPVTGCLQPAPVKVRAGTGINCSPSRLSGFAIPTWENRFVQWIGTCGFELVLLKLDHLWIAENIGGKIRVRELSGILDHQIATVPFIVRRELHSGIKTHSSWVAQTKSLGCNEIRLTKMIFYAMFPPTFCGRFWLWQGIRTIYNNNRAISHANVPVIPEVWFQV